MPYYRITLSGPSIRGLRVAGPIATTWRVYDGSAIIGRPVIAHGGRNEPTVVLDQDLWQVIRRQIEEVR